MNEQSISTATPSESSIGQSLAIPKSGIRLENGHLERHTKHGQVIGSHALRDITGLSVVKQLDLSCFLLGLGIVAGAVVTKYYIEFPEWSWTASCLLGVIGALFILGSWGIKLRVEADGAVAHYNLFDQDEACQGFHLSLVNEWRRVTKR